MMVLLFTVVFGAWGLLALRDTAVASTCDATAERHAVRIVGRSPDGTPREGQALEVYGGHGFYQEVGDGWVFALVPREHGWSIRLFDGSVLVDAVDLSAITPPRGGVVNPRDIFGWHFRNADNTGPNRGDVNAPQGMREFFFTSDPGRADEFRAPRSRRRPGR